VTKIIPSNPNLETWQCFSIINITEFHSTEVYSFLRRAEFGLRDNDPALKAAIILEFLVATINTEQYSHFPVSWFRIHGDWHPSIMKNLSFHSHKQNQSCIETQ